MIKILHVTFDMCIGGTEQVIKNIIQGCDNSQFEMAILCIESPLGPFAKELQENGITIFELNRKPGFDVNLIFRIRDIIKNHNFNLLHCHQYSPWVYGACAAILTKSQVIFTEHGRFYPEKSSFKRKLVNPLLNIITAQITAISNATKQALVVHEGIREKNIKVIYNGIKPIKVDSANAKALRQSLKIDDKQTVLGTVARLDPIKNHIMMLKAFSQLLKTHPNTILLIVGDGEEKANLTKLSRQLKINNKVFFTGYIEQPNDHIGIMDIFLLSSYSEGTPITLLEALSIGKPCVVTDVGGNPEIIHHDINGLICASNDHINFAESICAIVDDPDKYSKYSTLGKERFKRSFSIKTMADAYEYFYSNITANKA
ncbi:glycosyltransferase [Thalassotalea psychrophila]|uniref:Glycosyltransferase n=1 Tax=Thalassotalea psychrophila TaxID=3065647 RepID=A0ABY9TXQ3_9GAMM|nr:glycosyltransferase [Colwelliaceae bacterium SQ149]